MLTTTVAILRTIPGKVRTVAYDLVNADSHMELVKGSSEGVVCPTLAVESCGLQVM